MGIKDSDMARGIQLILVLLACSAVAHAQQEAPASEVATAPTEHDESPYDAQLAASIQQTLSTRLKTTVQLLHPWVMPLRRRRWSCTTTTKKTDLLRTDISRAIPRKKPRKSWSVWTLTRMARFLSRRSRLISKRNSTLTTCSKEPRQAQHPPLALLRIFKNWLMMMRKNFWRISTKTRMVTFPSRN